MVEHDPTESPRRRTRPGRTAEGKRSESDNLSERPKVSMNKRRVFRCQFCAKEFVRNEHLQRHERLHTKERPFRCTACPEAFTRSDLFARHARLLHSDAVVDKCDIETHPRHLDKDPEATCAELDIPRPPNPPLSGAPMIARSDVPASSNPEAHQLNLAMPETEPSINHYHIPWAQPTRDFSDFALFVDNMGIPCVNNLSTFPTDQWALPFLPTALFSATEAELSSFQWEKSNDIPPDITRTSMSESHLFDEFSSTFPSFERSSSIDIGQEPWRITQQGWNYLLAEIQGYIHIIPPGFDLPSRHTMTRYIATYFSGFHRHLPFLHLPTFSPEKLPVELVMAMAAIGAQSSFDKDNGVMLFRVSRAIVLERLHRDKIELRERLFPTTDGSSIQQQQPRSSPWPGHPSHAEGLLPGTTPKSDFNSPFDKLHAAQTLLLLLAMATWGNSRAICNEAVNLQNTLTVLVRDERFLNASTLPEGETWHQWVQAEGFKRTITVIFCFFMFHTIVYDTPPPILNSELNIHLPSREMDWAARSETEFEESRRNARPEPEFQSCLTSLFSKENDDTDQTNKRYSSLGGYTLILALIQHIYFLRKMSKYVAGPDEDLLPSDVASVEQALKNWQNSWYTDPESSLNPGNPLGPISFNSTALLRMAYIRLNVDVGPWRALNSHDPAKIAESMYHSPDLRPTQKLRRAVLYSAHALSIPVKIGINIVARNQAFTWSLQHSLCALEGALVLSKWLIAVERRASEMRLDEEEARLLAYIADMVAEADPRPCLIRNDEIAPRHLDLGARVVRVWAKLWSGEAVWDVVCVIGKVLEAYGQILEKRPSTQGFERASFT